MEPASFEYINTFKNKEEDPMVHITKKRSRDEAFPPLVARFLCECNNEPVADLKDHRKRCEKMGDKYGTLFDHWEAAVQRGVERDDADEWKNMRALYEHFRSRFIDCIEVNLKRRKVNALEATISASSKLEPEEKVESP
jgi:hypothetical protein